MRLGSSVDRGGSSGLRVEREGVVLQNLVRCLSGSLVISRRSFHMSDRKGSVRYTPTHLELLQCLLEPLLVARDY